MGQRVPMAKARGREWKLERQCKARPALRQSLGAVSTRSLGPLLRGGHCLLQHTGLFALGSALSPKLKSREPKIKPKTSSELTYFRESLHAQTRVLFWPPAGSGQLDNISLAALLLCVFVVFTRTQCVCLAASRHPKGSPKSVVGAVWPAGKWSRFCACLSGCVRVSARAAAESRRVNEQKVWIK